MNKLLLLLVVLFFLPFTLLAQNKTIKGKVVDETGNPVAGANILAQGTKTGVQTDNDGNFTITVSKTGPIDLLISYIGFGSKVVTVTGNDAGTVQLTKEVITQEDVVVVGYATIKRKDLTGSVSSINAKELKDFPLSSAAEALQGKLAGVQLTSTEGAPGAEIIVRVRGGGSITQDNSPLYIVDGVQVENALSVISPQDIATVDVLKDASTTAIYGARGANGVVIITTKGGRAGKTQITYNGSYGVRKLTQFQDVMQPYEFVTWQWERTRGATADSASFAQTYGTTWDTLQNYKNVPFVDWQDKVFGRSAKFSMHNVAVSGGNAATTFNLSLTANKEEGIQITTGFERKLVNFKIDHKATDKLRIGFTARYLDQKIDGSGTTNSGTRSTNRLRHTINYRPFELERPGFGVDDFDEAYYLASSGATNPIILTYAEYRKQTSKSLYLTGYASYNIIKNLTFRTTIGYDNAAIRTDQFFSKITGTARNFASLPVASIGQQANYQLTNSNTLQYTLNNFKEHHDFTVLAGQEIVDGRTEQNTIQTRYFPADITPAKALANMGLGTAPAGSSQPLPTSFINPPSRIASFFGRVTYAYDDKYLLSLNWRNDRSSKFSSENGALNFPSGSIAWRFSREKFFKLNWLNDGKFRVGYGAVGNNRIGDLLYRQLYGVTGEYAFNHSIVPGFSSPSLANPNLRWEKNTTVNFGLDLGMFNNKVQLTIDAYKNSAKNLLLLVAIPPTTGYPFQQQNIGATSNKGLEIQLSSTPLQRKNLSWNTSFNIAFNKNRVENLGGVQQLTRNSGWQGSDGVDDYLVKVGEPVGLMYGFVTDGFYGVDEFDFNTTTRVYTIKAGIATNGVYGTPQPGMLKWKDLNGDGVITADGDRQVIGNANAKFTGGWSNQVTYKNFDLSVFVNFVVGNDIYNANKIEWTDGAFLNLNMISEMNGRWTNINPANGQVVTDPTELKALNANAKIWSPVRVQRWWLHSWAVEDGSYLRINNVTLGYTLPKSLLTKIKIPGIRFFGTVNNLATLTGYSGYDPDVTARRTDPLTPGVDFAAYPRSRTWLFGVNVTF